MKLRRFLTDYFVLVLVIVALVMAFGFSTSNFLTTATFSNIANQIPDSMVLAVGMTFVLIIGGIDLSVGSVLALGSAVLGLCITRLGWPLLPAMAACLATGLLCGVVNGLVVVKWKLPSFIVTLGMLEIARGATYILTNSSTIYIGMPVERMTEISLFGLSLPFMLAIGVVVAGQLALSGTVFGRHSLALGANTESARLSGIGTNKVTVAIFGISGLLSAMAGTILCGRMGASDPNAGIGFELQAIAAVVIGGTSLMGGRGSVVNSFFGVVIIAVLAAGLATIGVQESTKRIVTGGVIVAAVVLDYYRHRLNKA